VDCKFALGSEDLSVVSRLFVASPYASEIGIGAHGLIHMRGVSLAAPYGSMLRPIPGQLMLRSSLRDGPGDPSCLGSQQAQLPCPCSRSCPPSCRLKPAAKVAGSTANLTRFPKTGHLRMITPRG
jgi:hypothetical protein